ncbi:MAG: hypothetical protein CVT92_08670 [Bacteroidetes bacterium HGW-Bacteroidetes-1]|jgi:hypothetical protein|nr:MAG: hypothetical protein CVT92_08670 [Bacteroidetes bacterium HGW-Bacteroidetes-1]
MKKILLLTYFVVSIQCANAQTPSTCTIPQELTDAYDRDIKSLALKRMSAVNSPDLHLINIPQSWQDTIAEGLAAIMNAHSLPESDTVFNIYCVHDLTTPFQIYNDLLIQVDVSYPWTVAWQNLNAITGNPNIDTLVTRYGLSVSAFYDWSFADYALLHTDALLNIYSLIDSLVIVPGVISGEPDAIIGTAGKIVYDKIGNKRYYDFYFQFNDCFDGCDNYRKWQFKVNEDCSVDFLGASDWGVFGIDPLPEPVNCNIFTSLKENLYAKRLNIYPNPANGIITISDLKIGNTIVIYDASGRTIFKTKAQQSSIQINLTYKGVYILEAIIQGEITKQKFIIH